MLSAAAKVETTIVSLTALRRSASRVAIGIANRRSSIGTASTSPISRASRPLASSQSGKNGI
jgi:hypothetical protein